jgi:hypothetical protein
VVTPVEMITKKQWTQHLRQDDCEASGRRRESARQALWRPYARAAQGQVHRPHRRRQPKNIHPLDLAFCLAEAYGIVLPNGGGFEATNWSLRISLANLPDET